MARAMPMKKPAMPKTMKSFEKSRFDKEPKGVKEGSPKDMALDKKQFAKLKAKK